MLLVNNAYASPPKQKGCWLNHFNSASSIKFDFHLDTKLILQITLVNAKK